MLEAFKSKKKDVQGVWGPSAFMNLKYFDIPRGMIVDFLHACLLGGIDLITYIVLKNSKEEYYIGSPEKLDLIDQRLLSMKPPTCLAKTPKSIKERSMWKGSEWFNWLLLYCLPCFEGILKPKYFENSALYVAAMHIFLNESITPDEIECAKILIIKFMCGFQNLYGDQCMIIAMHYNIYSLIHLADNVKDWGPLWVINTFLFES